MARRCLLWLLALLGLVLFAVSASLFVLLPDIIAKRVKAQLPLKNDSEALTKWKRVSVPIYLNVYVFNIDNPLDLARGHSNVSLTEIGPFVFYETREKDIDSFPNASSIFYNDIKTFYFDESKSKYSLDHEVTVINVPLVSITDKLAKRKQDSPTMGSLAVEMIKSVMKSQNERLTVRKKVRELLFEGYKVRLLEEVARMTGRFGVNLPPALPNNTFGLMYGKNGTSPGLFSLNTGVDDVMELKKVTSFKGRPRVPHWSGEYCNQINGTDGSAFHPQVKRKESLYLFNVDICRSAELNYERDSDVGGVSVYKFTMPDKFFKAPSREPDNACFCTKQSMDHILCSTDGILDISTCKKGSPIVISAPHFYKGSPSLHDYIQGLRPNKDLHETFLEIEPLTGLVFNAARRIQINVNLKNNPDFDVVASVNNMIMPFIWIEETAKANDKAIETYQSKIGRKLTIANALIICAMIVGVTLSLIFISLIILHSRKGRMAENTVPTTGSSYSSLPTKEPIDVAK